MANSSRGSHWGGTESDEGLGGGLGSGVQTLESDASWGMVVALDLLELQKQDRFYKCKKMISIRSSTPPVCPSSLLCVRACVPHPSCVCACVYPSSLICLWIRRVGWESLGDPWPQLRVHPFWAYRIPICSNRVCCLRQQQRASVSRRVQTRS